MNNDKLDSNGYSPSLMSDFVEYRRCYVCGRSSGKIDRHEVFFGPNRTNSKQYGMWCDLCRDCHNKAHRGDGTLNQELKKQAQQIFEETHTRKEFMQIFGRNYL